MFGSNNCILVVKPSMGLELQLRDEESYLTKVDTLPNLTMFDYEKVRTCSYEYLAIKCYFPDLIEAVLDFFYSIAYNRVVGKKSPLYSVINSYEQFKAILSRPAIPSEYTLTGLWGELNILSQAIKNLNIDPDSAVFNWTGPQGHPNDFSFGKTAIEVKTTKKQTNIVEISSFDQLDADCAWLIILHAYHAEPADGGQSIEMLKNSINGMLSAVAREVFDERISCVLNTLNTPPCMQYSMKPDGLPVIFRISDSIPLINRSFLKIMFGEAKTNLIERGKYILNLSSIEPSHQTVEEVFLEAQTYGEQNG